VALAFTRPTQLNAGTLAGRENRNWGPVWGARLVGSCGSRRRLVRSDLGGPADFEGVPRRSCQVVANREDGASDEVGEVVVLGACLVSSLAVETPERRSRFEAGLLGASLPMVPNVKVLAGAAAVGNCTAAAWQVVVGELGSCGSRSRRNERFGRDRAVILSTRLCMRLAPDLLLGCGEGHAG